MEWTNEQITSIAMRQSAVDANCRPEDFLRESNVLVTSVPNSGARKYLELPLPINLISYGSNIVASTQPELQSIAQRYIDRFPLIRCYETPAIYALNDQLAPHHLKVCFMAEYYLPDLSRLKVLDCAYELKILHQADFAPLYTDAWSNALCEKRKELDVLGVGAYDQDRLVGFAACSADCDSMWQIGVDVLPKYRRQGIASAITSRLALEILDTGHVPFYGAAWSNMRSARNAVKSGFTPVWVELTVKSEDFIDKLSS